MKDYLKKILVKLYCVNPSCRFFEIKGSGNLTLHKNQKGTVLVMCSACNSIEAAENILQKKLKKYHFIVSASLIAMATTLLRIGLSWEYKIPAAVIGFLFLIWGLTGEIAFIRERKLLKEITIPEPQTTQADPPV
jgi:hypothetical protein